METEKGLVSILCKLLGDSSAAISSIVAYGEK